MKMSFDMKKEIVYNLSVSAKLAEKYRLYEPATDGAGKKEKSTN